MTTDGHRVYVDAVESAFGFAIDYAMLVKIYGADRRETEASLQQRLVKTGGRLVKHARYHWLLLAEGHLNRRRFGAMLGRIAVLPLRTG